MQSPNGEQNLNTTKEARYGPSLRDVRTTEEGKCSLERTRTKIIIIFTDRAPALDVLYKQHVKTFPNCNQNTCWSLTAIDNRLAVDPILLGGSVK